MIDPAEAMNVMNGETRLHFCVGDPIAQVKSPEGLSAAFAGRGVNAVCIPAQVKSEDLAGFFAAAKRIANVDGFIVTVPHKLAALSHCDEISPRARLLGAVNVMRRRADGRWEGDMTDGIALLAALRADGFVPEGKRALLIGAGGAGSAVGLALLEASVASLVISDIDDVRRDRLVAQLKSRGEIRSGAADPSGFDLVVNATPIGMASGDPMPLEAARIDQGAVVADLITKPAITSLIAYARSRGARTVTGEDMFVPQKDILANFLLGAPT
jgi:shikimate dehydrogenase